MSRTGRPKATGRGRCSTCSRSYSVAGGVIAKHGFDREFRHRSLFERDTFTCPGSGKPARDVVPLEPRADRAWTDLLMPW